MLTRQHTGKNSRNLFVAGVPATGKSWLGKWLAEKHGFIHIDAEVAGGADFDRMVVRNEWNELISTGRAPRFVKAIQKLGVPVILDWGFPTRYLYIVKALQEEGFHTWWFHASKDLARQAFAARGGIPLECFDRQMSDIEREWLLINSVFTPRIVEGLHPNGSQRTPEEIWHQLSKGGF